MAYQSEIEKLQRRYEEKPEQWFAAYADAYRKAGELDVALEIVRSGIEERPNYVSGYIVLGRCLVDQGKDEEAKEAFEQVLALDAENIIALHNLGEVAERSEDIEGARRWLERLLEVDPMNDRARDSLERLASAPAPPAEDPGPLLGTLPDLEADDSEVAGAPADVTPGANAAPEVDKATAPMTSDETADRAPSSAEPLPSDGESRPTAAEEPGPELVSADQGSDAPSAKADDLSAVFATPPPPPEPPATAGRHAGAEPPRDRSGFFIERQSDPFETPTEAQEAEDDAAALWATLGEDPQLASATDADSGNREGTAHPSTASTDPTSRVAGEEEAGEIEPADDLEILSAPEAPESPVTGSTVQMSAADLNALVEQERREAEGRRRDADQAPDDEAARASDNEVIGAPPPESQLDRPDPRASEGVPVFSDPELMSEEPETEEPGGTPSPEPIPGLETADDPWGAGEQVGEPATADVSPSQPSDPAAAESDESDDVLTETMAEVYAAQGLFAEAKEVYRKLQETRPGDRDIQARLSAVEAREREAAAASDEPKQPEPSPEPIPVESTARDYAASRTGGESARDFLAALLMERPRGVERPAAEEPPESTLLDETFASDRSDSQGEPTRPAGDEMSLASVFGEGRSEVAEPRRPSGEHGTPPLSESSPIPSTPPAPKAGEPQSEDEIDLSFDSFFSGEAERPSGESGDEAGEEDGDDEDFKAWLKSLKS